MDFDRCVTGAFMTVDGFLEEIVPGLMLSGVVWLLVHRRGILRTARSVWFRGRRTRVSMSAILQIRRDGKYLLVRQLHRKDEFGPIGGVYKALGDGVPLKFGFIPDESTHQARAADLVHDLRGTIPAFRLPQFIRWFASRQGRESDALVREVQEELVETGIVALLSPPLLPLQAEFLWASEEGPTKVQGADHLVYRRHEVFALRGDAAELFECAEKDHRLLAATDQEIRTGRTDDGCTIGRQATYLLSRKGEAGERAF